MAVDLPLARFTEDEAYEANDQWRFNCGPASLCVLLGLTPAQIRPRLGSYRGFMSPTEMGAALDRLGRRYSMSKSPPRSKAMCTLGIARVQWDGPWLAPDANPVAAYRHTHWVASIQDDARGMCVFDVNALDLGGWLLYPAWRQCIAAEITRDIRRATGDFWVTHRFELQPPGSAGAKVPAGAVPVGG